MPMVPYHRCSSCQRLVSGRCPFCVKSRDRARPNANARGYNSARWRRLRLAKLEQDPLCSVCSAAGRVVLASDVDHLEAHTGPDDGRFWNWNNLDSKCHACHSRKTAMHDSTFANKAHVR